MFDVRKTYLLIILNQQWLNLHSGYVWDLLKKFIYITGVWITSPYIIAPPGYVSYTISNVIA